MLHNLLNKGRDLRDREGGFTLIELLIVIIVLGILAGIVVFGVATFRGDAQNSAKAANCKMVETASEAYNAKNGNYPASADVLVTDKYLKAAPTGVGATISNAGVISGCP